MVTGPCGVATPRALGYKLSLAHCLPGRCSGSSSVGRLISSPIADGDSLYVGDTKGRLYRLHRSNGRVLWQVQELGPLDSSPALAGELLYIGLRDGRLLAIQAADGVIRWSVETGNPIYASPLVHHGILYIGSRGWLCLCPGCRKRHGTLACSYGGMDPFFPSASG